MTDKSWLTETLKFAGLALWVLGVVLPICCLVGAAFRAGTADAGVMPTAAIIARTHFQALVVATVAVILGYLPGRLLATAPKSEALLLLLLLLPLVLPRYLLYYGWSLLLAPTSVVGDYLARHPPAAQQAGTAVAQAVLVSWYWPLAALVIAHSWRNLDRNVLDHTRLESGRWHRHTKVIFPHLAGSLLLALGICFVLSLSEFTTFHLAGVKTWGTELAVLFELTASAGLLARACWPVLIPAGLVLWLLHRWVQAQDDGAVVPERWHITSQPCSRCLFALLLAFSLMAPLLAFLGHLNGFRPIAQLYPLYVQNVIQQFPHTALDWSLVVATTGALMTLVLVTGIRLLRLDSGWRRAVAKIAEVTLLGVMLLPGPLIGVALLQTMQILPFPLDWRRSWLVVSAGCVLRYAGAAYLLLFFLQRHQSRLGTDMAQVDGAGPLRTWWYVHFPQQWVTALGMFILLVMLGMTEIGATGVLLPPGLPNLAQLLLNQMHYARDQQVIALCLVLVTLFLALTGVLLFLFRMVLARQFITLAGVCLLGVASGCRETSDGPDRPDVLSVFGQSGRGPGEFYYPRAIALTDEGDLLVVDKTGRIQIFNTEGVYHGEIHLPQIEAGLPTGITSGPAGKVYVADTHYHRVMIYDVAGNILAQFGSYGEEDGQFIYPTDVAISPEGEIFVSEYGGNDRVSVFSSDYRFLYTFGSPGSGAGELSRPSALCLDEENRRLYVADACNHRIAVYDYKGNILHYLGSPGQGQGQLHYPYDLTWRDKNTLVVCEYGNNRLQLYDTQGRGRAILGRAGRELGQLAYPWGVCVDGRGRAFVVDSGNNRVQIWQL